MTVTWPVQTHLSGLAQGSLLSQHGEALRKLSHTGRGILYPLHKSEASYSVGCARLGLNERHLVSLQAALQPVGGNVSLPSGILSAAGDRNWFAVFTVPQNEKSVLKHLSVREIESFLPTYETVRVWKNRQRMKVILPLFPTYLFVHITSKERVRVLQSPGVLQIVGNKRESVPLSGSEVEFLRAGLQNHRIEPYRELVVGERVRVKNGAMKGVQGTLVRRSGTMRFVLTLELINQHAAIQVGAEDLEPVVA